MKLRRDTFEVRITLSAILPFFVEDIPNPASVDREPMRCLNVSGWNRSAYLEYVGTIRARSEAAAAQKAIGHVGDLVADGIETIIYLERVT